MCSTLCCQITFLILLSVTFGFLMGIFIADEFAIKGLDDLGTKFIKLFKG